MIFDPVPYQRFDRKPGGCFTAQMMPDGWANTNFDHELEEHLLSDEVNEFVRVVHSFFTECADWTKLHKFTQKYCKPRINDDGVQTMYCNVIGNILDYTFRINGTRIEVFPYRKFKH